MEHKPAAKSNKLLIIIGVILAVLIIGGAIFYFTVIQDKVDKAVLSIESGQVQVDTGSGYKPASDGMLLDEKDKIKTQDATASVTLFDSIIVDLNSNTEISLEQLSADKVRVKQTSGSTWNKFTSVLGIGTYEVETPTTVATVRGTEFGVDADNEDLMVLDGEVDYAAGGKQVKLKEFQKAKFKNGELNLEELTPEERDMMAQKAEKMMGKIKAVRERMFERRRAMIEAAMEKYGKSESDLRSYLDKIDSGQVDDAALLEKSPVKLPEMQRLKKLNDEIKKQKRIMEKARQFREQQNQQTVVQDAGLPPPTKMPDLQGQQEPDVKDEVATAS